MNFHERLIDDPRRFTGIQPLSPNCRCYRCHSGYVGRVLAGVLTFVLLASFMAWVLS